MAGNDSLESSTKSIPLELRLFRLLLSRGKLTDRSEKQILTLRIREIRDSLIRFHALIPPKTSARIVLNCSKVQDLELVSTMLMHPLQFDRPNEANATCPRAQAALQTKIDQVLRLLDDSVDPSDSSSAASNEIRDILVDHACVGLTALHRAAIIGNVDLVTGLVNEKGFSVNSLSFSSQTPLHLAVELENVDVAKKLIELGADVSLCDYLGRTPFHDAPRFIVDRFLAAEEADLPAVLGACELDPAELETNELVGYGATASVHAGYFKHTQVAIKEMCAACLQRDFAREVRILMKLRHPNLVLFLGACTKRPPFRLVTELCTGGSLYELLHERPEILISKSQILDACIDTARGLEYLHTNSPQILHLDLTSKNLLLANPVRSPSCPIRVKIADFGVAWLVNGSVVSEPSASQGPGTWWWMSPEALFADYDEISEKSDMYPFGICLFEIITRRLPFDPDLQLLPPVTVAIKVSNGFRPPVPLEILEDSGSKN